MQDNQVKEIDQSESNSHHVLRFNT